jgi:hypothetical protein
VSSYDYAAWLWLTCAGYGARRSFWLWLERQAYRFGHWCHERHPERRHR